MKKLLTVILILLLHIVMVSCNFTNQIDMICDYPTEYFIYESPTYGHSESYSVYKSEKELITAKDAIAYANDCMYNNDVFKGFDDEYLYHITKVGYDKNNNLWRVCYGPKGKNGEIVFGGGFTIYFKAKNGEVLCIEPSE